MTIEGLAYWGTFFIPLILLAMTGFIRKLVDAEDFKREHWYLGIDLTIYLLAATLVNVLDLAKSPHHDDKGIAWTVVLSAGAVVMLIVQTGIHQQWVRQNNRPMMQLFMLVIFSNFLGILTLYAFVKLKQKGLI